MAAPQLRRLVGLLLVVRVLVVLVLLVCAHHERSGRGDRPQALVLDHDLAHHRCRRVLAARGGACAGDGLVALLAHRRRGRRSGRRAGRERVALERQLEPIAQDVVEHLRHHRLLPLGAVVLEGEHHRVVGCVRRLGGGEGRVGDRLEDAAHRDARHGRVLVVHDGLAVRPVEAVDLDAAAAHQEHAPVHVGRRGRVELVTRDVGVVGGGDEVVRERLRHVVADL